MGEQYSKLAEANKSNNREKTVKGYKDANDGRYQRPRHYKTYRPIGFVGVPSETATFVGRETELGELEAALAKSNCAILQALPGVGKSSLIVAYLRTQKDMYRNVIWLNSESVNSIVQGLNQVALKFNIRSESQVQEMHDFQRAEILEIYAALCEHPTMIVFNNATAYKDASEEGKEGIQRFFPPPSPGFFPKVIITTSFSTEWHQLQKQCSMLFLNSFSDEDSRELILKVINSSTVPDIDANWSKIARYFENLPIAIENASCVIKTFSSDRVPKSCYTTQNFIDEFVLEEPSESTGSSDSSPAYQKLEALWERTIEKLDQIFVDKGKQAVRLLKLLAFLSPDGVEVKVLFGILRRINSVIDVDVHLRDIANPALELLVSLSLVKSRGKYVTIHSLLQKNLMKLMTENGELIKYAVTLAQNINSRRTDFVSQEYNRQIHAFGKSIERILHNPKILNAIEANIDILEQFPYTAGSNAYAAIYGTQICFKGIYHEDSILTREALIHHNQRYCKAKGNPTSIHYDRVFQQEEMSLDERQTIEKYLRDTSRLRVGRGRVGGQYEHKSQNSAMGQLSGAMALEDESEDGAERTERKDYPEILTFLESDLSRLRLIFGADDDRTIETRNKLADHLNERGMYAAVLKLLIEDLARQRCVLGPDDPRTIGTRDTFLHSLRRQNKPHLAMELLKLDLLRQHLCFGLDDIRTIETRKKLVKEMSESRNYAELVEILKYDLFRQRTKFGSDDPRTLDSRNNLAENLFLRGSHDEAISLMNNDLLGQTADLGPDDPQSISTRNLLMDQLQRFLNDDQPVGILQLHFNRQRSSLGPDDPRTIQTRNLFVDHLKRVSENYDKKLQIFQSEPSSKPCENHSLDQLLMEEQQKNWFTGAFDLLESDESRLKYKQIMDQPKAVETKMAEIAELIVKETPVKYIPDTDAVNESSSNDVHSSPLQIQLRDQLSEQIKFAKLRDLSAQLNLPKAHHLQVTT